MTEQPKTPNFYPINFEKRFKLVLSNSFSTSPRSKQMTKPDYKTLLTTQFTKDLLSIYKSVRKNRKKIREDLDDDFWTEDIDWSVVEYFIYDLEELAEYLEANK